MNFLADENFPGSAVRELRSKGFAVAWVVEDLPGASDEVVIARCSAEKLTLLTLDKDFGELVFRRGMSNECGVILFRLDSESPEVFCKIVTSALELLNNQDKLTGNFVVVEQGRIRLRSIPGI